MDFVRSGNFEAIQADCPAICNLFREIFKANTQEVAGEALPPSLCSACRISE
jgi:hypothetical protein